MLMAEDARAQTHTQSELDEYSCLHKLCFTSANSRQTFSQNAHEADQQPLPPSPQPPLTAVLDSASFPLLTPTINPAHSTLPSVSSFHLTSELHTPFLSLPPLFLQHHSSFSSSSSVLRILTHMAGFDDFTSLRGPPRTWMTSLSLNHPLISTAGGAVHLEPAPILPDKSSSHAASCIF